MINALTPTDFIRDDTKDLVAYAEMGEYPCKYCVPGERRGCANVCRAWPVWFSVHWKEIQNRFGVIDNA